MGITLINGPWREQGKDRGQGAAIRDSREVSQTAFDCGCRHSSRIGKEKKAVPLPGQPFSLDLLPEPPSIPIEAIVELGMVFSHPH